MPALWTGYRYRGGVALHGAADDRIRKLSATARALSWNAGRPRRLDCSVVLDAEGDTIARDQPLRFIHAAALYRDHSRPCDNAAIVELTDERVPLKRR